jgi:hypothetical protein
MRTFALASGITANEHVALGDMLPRAKIHKLTLIKYLTLAVNQNLLYEKLPGWYCVTQSGMDYLEAHEIIN